MKEIQLRSWGKGSWNPIIYKVLAPFQVGFRRISEPSTVCLVYLPPRKDAIVTNEGLAWFFPILKMVHNPGGDEPASWVGGIVPGYK